LVTNSEDGLAKNYYVYKKNEETGIRIAPWDYDHTFGRDGDNEPSWESFIDCNSNFMLKRLLKLNPNNYRESLKRRYIELKERGILTSEYINGMIQENYKIIEPCLDRNAAAWPTDAVLYYDSLNTSQELELIKKWTVKHMKQVDELMLAN
jgi:spore coat protein CotH